MQTNTKMIYQHERRLHLLGSAIDNLGTETYSSMYLQVSSSYGLNARGRYHTTASWPLLQGMQGAFIVGKTASCWSQWRVVEDTGTFLKFRAPNPSSEERILGKCMLYNKLKLCAEYRDMVPTARLFVRYTELDNQLCPCYHVALF